MSERFDDVEIDAEAFRVTRAGAPGPPGAQGASSCCCCSPGAPGRQVTKAEIQDAVWAGTFVTDNALTRLVAQIRKGRGDDPKAPRYVETVPTLGYRWVARPGGAPGSCPESAPSAGRRPHRGGLAAAAAAAAVVALGVAGFGLARAGRAPGRVSGRSPGGPDAIERQVSTAATLNVFPRFSPDGASVAFCDTPWLVDGDRRARARPGRERDRRHRRTAGRTCSRRSRRTAGCSPITPWDAAGSGSCLPSAAFRASWPRSARTRPGRPTAPRSRSRGSRGWGRTRASLRRARGPRCGWWRRREVTAPAADVDRGGRTGRAGFPRVVAGRAADRLHRGHARLLRPARRDGAAADEPRRVGARRRVGEGRTVPALVRQPAGELVRLAGAGGPRDGAAERGARDPGERGRERRGLDAARCLAGRADGGLRHVPDDVRDPRPDGVGLGRAARRRRGNGHDDRGEEVAPALLAGRPEPRVRHRAPRRRAGPLGRLALPGRAPPAAGAARPVEPGLVPRREAPRAAAGGRGSSVLPEPRRRHRPHPGAPDSQPARHLPACPLPRRPGARRARGARGRAERLGDGPRRWARPADHRRLRGRRLAGVVARRADPGGRGHARGRRAWA